MRAGLLSTILLFLTGCGYVGPVVPPSPNIPGAITDLAVVERGDKLVVTCSAPVRTTDSVVIKRLSEVDLEIGPDIRPFDLVRWSARAKRFELPIPPDTDRDDPKSPPLEDRIPVSTFSGQKRLAVAIRTSAKSDHYSQWSNVVHLELVEPLDPPAVTAQATADGIKLTWNPQRSGLHYSVLRKSPADKEAQQMGVAETAEFVDVKSAYDTPYTYTITAQEGSAESLPGVAAPNPMIAKDVFPPSVPSAVTALAAATTIEVTWERSPEADLKGYYVFRSVNAGPFERQPDLLTIPTFSDHNVEHGKTYRYSVSATDQLGNTSNRSAASADVTF